MSTFRLFKTGHPRLFFVYFCLFKQVLQSLQQIKVKKCPSSMRCWNSNPQPTEHESPPITTRPGLQPVIDVSCIETFTMFFESQQPHEVSHPENILQGHT